MFSAWAALEAAFKRQYRPELDSTTELLARTLNDDDDGSVRTAAMLALFALSETLDFESQGKFQLMKLAISCGMADCNWEVSVLVIDHCNASLCPDTVAFFLACELVQLAMAGLSAPDRLVRQR